MRTAGFIASCMLSFLVGVWLQYDIGKIFYEPPWTPTIVFGVIILVLLGYILGASNAT